VLAGLERVFGHGEMHEVGCADVHCVDGRIFQNPAVIGVDFLDLEFGAQARGLLDLAFADGIHLNVAQPANAFQMDTAHEAGAEYRRFESMHDFLQFGLPTPIQDTPTWIRRHDRRHKVIVCPTALL